MQQNIQEVNSKTNLIHYIRLAQLQFNFKKIIVKYWNWPEFKYNGFFNRNIINAIKHYTEYIEAKHLLEFFLKFLCFLKYSFNANKTHNCIFKMNIIALFLHILWDRKCKVTDSCFRSRDSDLFLLSNGPGFRSPQLTQKWGLHTHWAQGPCVGARTHGWHTQTDNPLHADHTQRLSNTLPLFRPPIHPACKGTPQSPICARPCEVHCWLPLNYKTNQKPCLLPTESIPVTGHTHRPVKLPRGCKDPL